jgi:hypothetical protein
MDMRRIRLSYANVVSTMALFLAVAGGTTAVALSGKNNVDANDIRQGAVDSREVRNSSLTGGDIADGTVWSRELGTGAVGGEDIKANAVTGAAVADGSLGTADVDEASLFNDNSLTGLDIAEGTLFNDNSLGAADIDEASLPFQTGNGVTKLTGGQVPNGEEASTPIPSGTLAFECSGNPALTYSNTSGSTTQMFDAQRTLVFEDDGVANNGQVRVGRNDALTGQSYSTPVEGVGGAGRSELAVLTSTHVIWAKIFASVGVSDCPYVMELTVEPL